MDRLLSTLLIEIDGLVRHDGTVMAVMGITQHRSWVDSALTRPGRLHDNVCLAHPDYSTRLVILQSLLPKYRIDFTTPFHLNCKTYEDLAASIAACTEGWSAAEVKAICVESVRIALSEALAMGKLPVDQDDIILSSKHIQGGLSSVKR